MSETTIDFKQLIIEAATQSYAAAAENNLLDEFEYIDECSNHLWDEEGLPILATVYYALKPSVRSDIAEVVVGACLLFINTFESKPDYSEEHLRDDYLTRFAVENDGEELSVPLTYQPEARRRAETERLFTGS